MPVNVPKGIGPLDVVFAPVFHLPITQYLPDTINSAQELYDTVILYAYSLPS